MKRNNILKRLVLTTIALLLICNISSLAFEIKKSTETNIMSLLQQDIVHVNDDFPEENDTWFKTIQSGVNHFYTNGTFGTVIVHSGRYNESVIIKKSVMIIGAQEYEGYGNDSYPPIVYDPSVTFIVIGNNAIGTSISHFNITGGSVAGVLVLDSKSINISYNNISFNRHGIFIMSSDYCNIAHNNVMNNTKMGISLENSKRNNIQYNWVVDNKASGIDTVSSNFVKISKNHMENNGNYNIWIAKSNGTNEIISNEIIDSENFSRIRDHRWADSKNYWNDNYWSDDKTKTPSWYFIWGIKVFGYSITIPGPFQVDSASSREGKGYRPNEI